VPKYVVGIHPGHDPNIGIVDLDSKYLFHHEAERVSRLKHGGPIYFDRIFSKLNIDIKEIEFFILSADLHVHSIFLERDNTIDTFKKYLGDDWLKNVPDMNKKLFMFDSFIEKNSFMGKDVHVVRHHVCHSAYTYFTSPFDKSVIFSYDGIGYMDEFALSSLGENNKINNFRNYPLFGVGFIYNIITIMIFNILSGKCDGFWEGKTMALSSYGKPTFLKLINDRFYIPGDPLSSASLITRYKSRYGEGTAPQHLKPDNLKMIEEIHSDIYQQEIKLTKENFFEYACDLAASWQKYFEDLMVESMQMLKDHYGLENLCISGGCGLNGLINYKLQDVFKNIYIAPATSDCGIGLGAALYGKHVILNLPKIDYGNVAYLGSDFTIDESIFKDKPITYRKLNYEEIYDYIANELINQKIIAWYQGRSESGPRALGNRSILCDPRDPNMKDILNEKVKHRESFRPFAPAVLKEFAKDYFYNVDDDKYMLKITKVKEEHLKSFPAAIHVDNTARLQAVSKEDNLHFYNLIYKFYEKTKLPILLNTSFNDNGEPIVDSPEDAIKTFLNTKINILVLKDYVIEKKNKNFEYRRL